MFERGPALEGGRAVATSAYDGRHCQRLFRLFPRSSGERAFTSKPEQAPRRLHARSFLAHVRVSHHRIITSPLKARNPQLFWPIPLCGRDVPAYGCEDILRRRRKSGNGQTKPCERYLRRSPRGVREARNQRAGGIELKMLLIVGPSSVNARNTASATRRIMSAYSTRPWPRLTTLKRDRCVTMRSPSAELDARAGSIRIVTIPHRHIHRIASPIARESAHGTVCRTDPSLADGAGNHCLR